MAYTFYDSTIPVLQGIMGTLSHILKLAEQHSPDTSILLTARLSPDMLPLPDQIRICTQYAENLLARLANREPTAFGENPASFSEFYERIDKVMKGLGEADKGVVNKSADEEKETQLGPGRKADVSGGLYAHGVVLPNVYFHLGVAYGILRAQGVPLGKKEYYVGFMPAIAAGSHNGRAA